MAQMKDNGYELNENVTYENMKTFLERKAYRFDVSTEHHIRVEMSCVDAILPYLYMRNWFLIQATNESGHFITTDNPVNLTWNEPDKIPPLYRNSPGFGLQGTRIYFPLSRNLALLGEFDGSEGLVQGTKKLVASLNSKMLSSFYKQIYAPSLGFHFLGNDCEILNGSQILKYVNNS
jgi:hypothetical protein